MKINLQVLSGYLLILMIISVTTVQNSLAQQAETLFSNNVTYGGFGGPVVKMGSVADGTGVWIGGRGGWIINFETDHSISLGGGGYGLVTEHLSTDSSDLYAMNGYGGFEIEYTNKSFRLIHISVSTLIGAGGLMLRDRDFESSNEEPNAYFALEPGVNAELNVTNFFRVSAGINYLFTSGINRFGFNDRDFSGFNGVIAFKFGKFL